MSEPASMLDTGNGQTVAVGVGAGGVLAFVLGWLLHSRLLRLLGLVAAGTGGVLYAREQLAERNQKIDAAESSIRSTLDDLDPVARAQILIDLAKPD
jgi:hypothetical protein